MTENDKRLRELAHAATPGPWEAEAARAETPEMTGAEGTSDHPEDHCHRCLGPNFSWFTPGAVWDPVMRADGQWKWQEIICPLCFVELAGGGTWTLLPTKSDGGPWTSADERAALIEQARAEGKAEADAAWAARVEALANKWQDGFRHKSGPFVRGEGDCSDDLRALIPADSTALDQVRAQAKAEGLREAAEWVIGCEHVSSMKWCGICQQWATALNDEADRIGSAL